MLTITANQKYKFTIDNTNEGIVVNDVETNADIQQLNAQLYHVLYQNKSYRAEVVNIDRAAKTAEIKVNGNTYHITARDQFDALLEQMGLSNLNSAKISELKAPMPGLVLKLFVQEGSEVKKGESLFILEAMKMENIIKAPADAVVKAVKISAQDKVEKGQVLLQFV